MKKLRFSCEVNSKLKDVVKAFDLPLFKKLAPPLVKMNILQFDGCLKGDEVKFSMNSFGIQQYWYGLILDDFISENEAYFIDVGKKLPWPLTAWHHKHGFKVTERATTEIIDELEFECNSKLMELVLVPLMIGYFSYRKIIYKKEFNV